MYHSYTDLCYKNKKFKCFVVFITTITIKTEKYDTVIIGKA